MKKILFVFMIFTLPLFSQTKANEIYEIQGTGLESPYLGQNITTQNNVVTFVLSNGFYMQTPDSRDDNNPETSNGINVYTSSTPTVAVGDLINLSGTVSEYYGLTEITSPAVSIISQGNSLPTPILWDENTPSTTPSADNIYMERFEGMLVEFYNGLTCSGTNIHGDFYAIASNTQRAFREPGIDYPGVSGYPVFDGNPEVFEIDTFSDESSATKVKGGSAINYVKGVVRYSYGEFGIFPIELDVDTDISLDVVTTAGSDEYSIGSLNLHVFTDDSATEYTLRLSKISKYIREVMGSPDIIALQEVENSTTLNGLIAKLQQDDPTAVYSQYLEDTDWNHNNTAFLYKSRIDVSNSRSVGGTAVFQYNNTYYDTFDRAPLELIGTVNGFSFKLINLHLKARVDIDDPTQGGFVRAKRNAQATWMSDYIQDLQVANPDQKIMVVGDFNQFEFTDGYVDVLGEITGIPDPLGAMYPASTTVNPTLVNQAYKTDKSNRFSYLYEGDAQVLDHILVSQNFDSYISYIKYPHANTDYPEYYGDDSTTPIWATDHDGVVVRFKTTQVGIQDEYGNPTKFVLFQNYPNPFSAKSANSGETGNSTTTIRFSVPNTSVIAIPQNPPMSEGVQSQQSSTNNEIASVYLAKGGSQVPRNDNVRLVVYNSLGQQVAELLNKPLIAGNYEVEFDASKLTSGIYFYRLQSGNFVSVKKMMLIK